MSAMHMLFILGLITFGVIFLIWGIMHKKSGRGYIFLIAAILLLIAGFNAYWFKYYSFWHENMPYGQMQNQ